MSFLRSTVSRSVIQPLSAQRSLSSLAEIKLIGRLTRDPDFLQTRTGKGMVGYTIAVDNPSSFGKDASGKQKEKSVSYYRVAIFYEDAVVRATESVDNKQLGSGSLVHVIAGVEQAPIGDLKQTGSNGTEYPVMQFNLVQKQIDILLPSTARRKEIAEAAAAQSPSS